MKNIFLIGVLVLLFSCSGSKYSMQNLPDERIEFGSRGGFTGAKMTYILCKNGQIFVSNGFKTEAGLRVKRSLCKEIFREAARLKKTGYQFNQMGNLAGYIDYYDGGIQVQQWLWPLGGSTPAPEPLGKLNQMMLQACGLRK